MTFEFLDHHVIDASITNYLLIIISALANREWTCAAPSYTAARWWVWWGSQRCLEANMPTECSYECIRKSRMVHTMTSCPGNFYNRVRVSCPTIMICVRVCVRVRVQYSCSYSHSCLPLSRMTILLKIPLPVTQWPSCHEHFDRLPKDHSKTRARQFPKISGTFHVGERTSWPISRTYILTVP